MSVPWTLGSYTRAPRGRPRGARVDLARVDQRCWLEPPLPFEPPWLPSFSDSRVPCPCEVSVWVELRSRPVSPELPVPLRCGVVLLRSSSRLAIGISFVLLWPRAFRG